MNKRIQTRTVAVGSELELNQEVLDAISEGFTIENKLLTTDKQAGLIKLIKVIE